MNNMIAKTKIDWCDYVWNPVWGCLTGCDYCYARRFAKRFWKQMYIRELAFQMKLENEPVRKSLAEFKPVFLESNFNKKFSRKPSRIFVNSMSDIYWWEEKWMKIVLQKIQEYPQHSFLFLTKFPVVYSRYEFPANCWLGVTVDLPPFTAYKMWELASIPTNNIRFICFEPLRGVPITIPAEIDWIIIGAQTNPYFPPPKEWVENIVEIAKSKNIPVFIKNNINRAYPDLIIKEFPDSSKCRNQKEIQL